MKRNIPILLTIVALLFSCSSKRSPINELSNLSEEISTNGNSYNDEDWEAAAEKFEGITEELERYSYSEEEQKEIGKLKARVYYLFGSKYGKNKLKQIFNELSGAAEEFENINIQEDLEDLFEE